MSIVLLLFFFIIEYKTQIHFNFIQAKYTASLFHEPIKKWIFLKLISALKQADFTKIRAWHPVHSDEHKFVKFLDTSQSKQEFEVIKPHVLMENSQLSRHCYFLAAWIEVKT